MTFGKRLNYGDIKKVSDCQGCREERGINRRRAQGIFRVVKLFCMVLHWWIHVIKRLSNPQFLNYNINYGLWMTKICQGRFVSCNRCTTQELDVDTEGGCVLGMGAEDIQELCTVCSTFL